MRFFESAASPLGVYYVSAASAHSRKVLVGRDPRNPIYNIFLAVCIIMIITIVKVNDVKIVKVVGNSVTLFSFIDVVEKRRKLQGKTYYFHTYLLVRTIAIIS